MSLPNSNTEAAFVATGETVRRGRVVYDKGTTREGISEIEEADTTGSLAAGEFPLGILEPSNVVDESVTDTILEGQPVTVFQDGIETWMTAGAAIDITTVANRQASWDNQGRGRVGVPGTDFILGEFRSSTTAAGQLIKIKIMRRQPTAS
jgi:hypothetical protein